MFDVISSVLGNTFYETGVNWLWRASAWFSVAALLVLALRPLLHKLSATLAYTSWLLLPLMLSVMLLTSQLPPASTVSLPAGLLALTADTQAAVATLAQPIHFAPWVFAVWLLGALIYAAIIARQHRRSATGLIADSAQLAFRHLPELRAPDARGPALLGVWRPRLVLPHNFEQRFDAQEQTLIRAHEAVHRARYDHAVNALAASLLWLQWFNPIAHIAWRRMRVDQEMSCDAAVLRTRPESLAAYARALIKAQGEDLPNLFACQWQSRHPLVERISMLQKHTPSPTATRLGRAILMAGALITTAAVYATQTLHVTTATDAPFFKLAIQIRLDGKDWLQPTLIVQAGKRAKLSMSNAENGRAWDIEIETLALPDRKLDLKTVISQGLPWQVIARPRLIAREGETARVELTTEDGAHRLRLDVVGTLMSEAEMNTMMAPSQRK